MSQGSTRQGAAIVAAMILASLAWAGGEPWNSKPYQQWNDNDITKVLHQSPWTYGVTVEQTWKVLSPADLAAGGGATAGSSAGVGGTGAGGSNTILPAEHDSSAYTKGPDAHFDVYWSSSRTLREALARRAVLHNGNDPASADQYVNAPKDEYEVLVQGPDMAPFQRKDEKEYAGLAWLQIKSSKEKIAPSHVMYTRDDKNAVTGAVFYFPKKKADGSPTIPEGAKAADFYCKVGASTMRANFDLQKMQDQKGMDL